jgi:hypothetical protein
MTEAQRIAMIRAAHRRLLRASRYAEFVAIGAGEDNARDVPCVIGTAPVELAPVTVATREPWGVR